MGYVPLLSLPAPSLFGLPFRERVSRLKHAGFSGIELFLFPYAVKHLKKYQSIAHEASMRLSLHQPWSYEEGAIPLNRILDIAGYLPHDGYPIAPLVRDGNKELFVVYCDRQDEVEQMLHLRCSVNVAFQTACAWNGIGEARTHRMPYREFVNCILPTKTPIVFDTFHVLEWRLGGKSGGRALASYGNDELAEELLSAWREIGSNRIVEIHWNDFIRNSVAGGGDGRACIPGDGALAKGLRALAEELKRDDWRGPIVPELSPFLLFPYCEHRLTQVRERMEKFFV